MTITVRPLAAVIAIAIIGILIGLAIGNITKADSTPAASTSSAETRLLGQINTQLKTISTKIGTTTLGTVNDNLNAIENADEDVAERIGASYASMGTVRGLLREICQGTPGAGYPC